MKAKGAVVLGVGLFVGVIRMSERIDGCEARFPIGTDQDRQVNPVVDGAGRRWNPGLHTHTVGRSTALLKGPPTL